MSQIRTHQLFPQYHSSTRTEFRLEPKVYLNTFRLANIQPHPSGPIHYQYLNGVGCLFQSITIFSGNTVIEESRNTHEWLAFNQLRSSNPVALDIEHSLSGTRWGGWKLGPRNDEDVEMIEYGDTAPTVGPDDDPTDLTKAGTLSLQSALQFLKADDVVPLIPDLRIVIEWKTDSDVFAGDSDDITFSMDEPVLFADEVVGQKLLSSVTEKTNYRIPYYVMEFDRVRIRSVVNEAVQDETVTLRGFNGKSVRRMLVVNVPESNEHHGTDAIKKDGSSSQTLEKFNFLVNGRNYFPQGGIDSENKKLSTLAYSWGTPNINIPQGIQFNELENRETSFLRQSTVDNLRGMVSYFGMYLGQRISELQVVYSRTGRTSGTPEENNELLAFYMDVWCEVGRVLSVNSGRVQVSYA